MDSTVPLKTDGVSTLTADEINEMNAAINSKQDKIAGKSLSTNDYTTGEKAKLAGIQTQATANSTDAQLRDRATHTGQQPSSTISDFSAAARHEAATMMIEGNHTNLSITYNEVTGTLDMAAAGGGGGGDFTIDSVPTDGSGNAVSSNAVYDGLVGKVDKVDGKQLSTEDYTTLEKNKLAGIQDGATVNSTDAQLRDRNTHTGQQSADTIIDGTVNKVYPAADKTKLAGIAIGATANSADAFLVNRSNHTGLQSADTITDGTNNKVYSAADKTKLAGIAAGATANATDAQLRDRSTHTGTQPYTTIDGLDEEIQDMAASMFTNGTHTGITFVYDDVNGKVNASVNGGGTGGTPITVDATPVDGSTNPVSSNGVFDALTQKADAVAGKQLSTEDYTTGEKNKLAGISAGATVNATDAALRDRSTHTGTQAASTIVEDSTHRFTTDTEKSNWNAKADLLSPALGGNPTTPTPTLSNGIANKSYVDTAVAGVSGGSGANVSASFANAGSDYAAAGDGTTNDQLKLQNMLDSSHKTMYLEKGKVYATGAQLTVKSSGLTLYGNGAKIIPLIGTFPTTGSVPILAFQNTTNLSSTAVSIALKRGQNSFVYSGAASIPVGSHVKLTSTATPFGSTGSPGPYDLGWFTRVIDVDTVNNIVYCESPCSDNFTATSISATTGLKDIRIHNLILETADITSFCMVMSNCNNVEFHGCTFRNSNGTGLQGVKASGNTNFKFIGCTFEGFNRSSSGSPYGTGCELAGHNGTVEKCTVLRNGEGVVGGSNSYRSTNLKYISNTVKTAGWGKGLDFHGNCENVEMYGNELHSVASDTYALQVRCRDAKVIKNTLHLDNSGNAATHKGIVCQDAMYGNLTIEGNNVYAIGRVNAIAFGAQTNTLVTSDNVNNIKIIGNYLEGQIEMSAGFGAGIEISGNTFNMPTVLDYGIWCDAAGSSAKDLLIERNTFFNASTVANSRAMRIGANMGYVTINNNKFYTTNTANTTAPIQVLGIQCVVTNNTSYGRATSVVSDSSTTKENYRHANKLVSDLTGISVSAYSSLPPATAWMEGRLISVLVGSVTTPYVCVQTGSSTYEWQATNGTGSGTGGTSTPATVRHIYSMNTDTVAANGTGADLTIHTFTIPGNSIGTNGSFDISGILSFVGTTATKTAKIRMNGVLIWSGTITNTNLSTRFALQLFNQGAMNAQVFSGSGTAPGSSTSQTSKVAIDTASDITVTVQCSLNAADTVQLNAIRVVGVN